MCVAGTPRAAPTLGRCTRELRRAPKARRKLLKVLVSRGNGRHGTLIGPMGKNRVFFPQAALDLWISEGKVDLAGDELTIKAEARRGGTRLLRDAALELAQQGHTTLEEVLRVTLQG